MQRSILGSRYRIVEHIAKSVFSETYLTEDIQLPGKDKCVVKQLHNNLDDPDFIKAARNLLKSKAEIINNLGQQDQIPQLLTYFEEDKKLYLVQKYIKGQTIAEKSTQGKSWLEGDVLELLQDCINISNFIQNKKAIRQGNKSGKSARRQSSKKIILADLDTLKEIIPTLAALRCVLDDMPQIETNRDISADRETASQSTEWYGLSQDDSSSAVNRPNSHVREQRKQALSALKHAAQNKIERWLSAADFDLQSAIKKQQSWKKVGTEYQKNTDIFNRDLFETRQHNHTEVSNQISQVNPKWNALRHKTQKVDSKNINWGNRSQNINWSNRSQNITPDFTVGELIGSRSKPPTTAEERGNLIKVALLAQRIRKEWGSGIVINSGYRDSEYNRQVGGATQSQHILGKALDIRPSNGKIYEFHEWLYRNRDEFGIGGFGHGQHRGFVHVDIGDYREWTY